MLPSLSPFKEGTLLCIDGELLKLSILRRQHQQRLHHWLPALHLPLLQLPPRLSHRPLPQQRSLLRRYTSPRQSRLGQREAWQLFTKTLVCTCKAGVGQQLLAQCFATCRGAAGARVANCQRLWGDPTSITGQTAVQGRAHSTAAPAMAP